jgi:hypothetical protein
VPSVEVLDPAVHGLVLAQARGLEVHLRLDRRSGVVAAELAHLPLPRDHPQRVAHFRAKRAIELLCARPALEAVPRGDAVHRPGVEHAFEVVDDVFARHG